MKAQEIINVLINAIDDSDICIGPIVDQLNMHLNINLPAHKCRDIKDCEEHILKLREEIKRIINEE
jgi:hypothetical protein